MTRETKLKKLISFVEDYSPGRYSIILMLPIGALIAGFLIWNIYLYTFGFIEDEILRSKFILSGFVFILITFGLVWLVKFVLKFLDRTWGLILFMFHRLRNDNPRGWRFFLSRILIPILIIWLFIYTLFIFPILPTIIGGGQPRALSLIAISMTMPILNSLEIPKADGADYQTANLCIVHENSHAIYVLRKDRVLVIDRSLFQGFASLPGVNSILAQECIDYAYTWSWQGFYFGVLLLERNLLNFFGGLWRYQKIYFYLSEVRLIVGQLT